MGADGSQQTNAGDCGLVGSNSEPERSGRQGLSSILLFLCKTTVSEFETPPGDVWAQCCHGFIKGPRGNTEPLQAPPMSSLGMSPIGAPGLTDFRAPLSSGLVFLLPLTCWSEAQEPPTWLHPQGLDSEAQEPPTWLHPQSQDSVSQESPNCLHPGPRFWDSLGVSKTLTLLYLLRGENVLNAAVD